MRLLELRLPLKIAPHATADDGRGIGASLQLPSRETSKAIGTPFTPNSHSHWFARLALLVTAFLHTRQECLFRSCAILLALLNSIFLAPGGYYIR